MTEPAIHPSSLEKGTTAQVSKSSDSSAGHELPALSSRNAFSIWIAQVFSANGIEKRGIERVLPHERQPPSNMAYVQVALMWFGANLTGNNLAVGLLGPLVYQLSFLDSALCSIFGIVVGGFCVAYMSTWGPISGNRTMVCFSSLSNHLYRYPVWKKHELSILQIVTRYFMGYYPGKICCLLNIIIMLGWGLIDCLIGGQILSAVADGHLSIIAGIIINAVTTWIVATFGMSLFHTYER